MFLFNICIPLPECINFVISIFQSAHHNMELILEAYSLNFANSLMLFLITRKRPVFMFFLLHIFKGLENIGPFRSFHTQFTWAWQMFKETTNLLKVESSKKSTVHIYIWWICCPMVDLPGPCKMSSWKI